ncbi:MAG: T9SS type A sorting domain-containing protein [Candidatus Cloacimonadota bacterium]|nr:T9SS type A sorting domain-containing protein [Candidatus Cloacimonadota bacterium]
MAKKILLLTAFILLLICSNLLGEEILVEIWNPGGEVHDGCIWIETTMVLEGAVWESGITPYYFPVENPPVCVWAYGNRNGFYPGQEFYVSAYDCTQWNPETEEWFVTLELTGSGPVYEFRTTTLSAPGWNWVSFPVMDTNYADPVLHVLEPILDDLVEVRYKDDKVVYHDLYGWHNDLGDFRSIDGYKIKMNNDADLTVAGYWAGHPDNPDIVIPLYEGEENWIGYFLPETQDCEDAFGDDWDKVISIKAEDWYYHIPYQNPTKYVPGEVCPRPGPPRPLECGEGYIVKVDEDILDFTWRNSGNTKEPYGKAESDYFTFEKAADYMPIFVDSSEVTEDVNEVGVFIDDECIGASKVEEYPVLILAYVEDDNLRDGSELSFQLYNGTKNVATQVNDVAVYDPVTFAYVDKPVYLNKDDFVIVRLNTEEAPEIPREFTLSQNYPNPVKSSTIISFSTAEGAENAEIEIYNVKGQLVKTIVPVTNDKCPMTKVVWNGKDQNGKFLASGIYFYKLTSGDKSAVKKMVLLR